MTLVEAKSQRQGYFEGLGLPCEFRAFWGFRGLSCMPRIFLGIRALLMGSFCEQHWLSCEYFLCTYGRLTLFDIYNITLKKIKNKVLYFLFAIPKFFFFISQKEFIKKRRHPKST